MLCVCTYSQPPASPSTQEAIQGMLSMANLQSSDTCLQPAWNNSQAKSNPHSGTAGKKPAAASNNKRPSAKRPPKKPRKSSSVDSGDMFDDDDDQDHLDACFKDSDYGKIWHTATWSLVRSNIDNFFLSMNYGAAGNIALTSPCSLILLSLFSFSAWSLWPKHAKRMFGYTKLSLGMHGTFLIFENKSIHSDCPHLTPSVLRI